MVSQKDGAIIGIGALILLGGGVVGKKVLGGLTGGSGGGGASGETLAEDTQLQPIYNDYRTFIDETGEDVTGPAQNSVSERTLYTKTTTSQYKAPTKTRKIDVGKWPRHIEGDPIASDEAVGIWPLAKNPWGVDPWPTDDGDPIYVPPQEPKKLALILPASPWAGWYDPEDSN